MGMLDTHIPPLSGITMGMATRPPPPFTATHTPVLPTALALTGWPPVDKIPEPNSPEVQAWMKELEGITIPDILPTKDSSCAADPEAAAEAEKRGWWTCGGYTRTTDIAACPDKLHWGVSFDDGPSPYSINLIAKLKEKNIRATFFVVGSRVIQRPGILIEEYMNGHEISVHTWSHTVRMDLRFCRFSIEQDDRVRAISLAMGMVPILWTSNADGGKFDSNDWRVASGELTGPQVFTIFEDLMRNGTSFNTGFITLQHDLFEITVDLAVGYTLDAALSHDPKFVLQPVGECMGMPAGAIYNETKKDTAAASVTASVPEVTQAGKAEDVDATKPPGTSAALAVVAPVWGFLSIVGLAMVGVLG
ncbi:hypothetical protein CPB84DRAFT_1770184 [Gymnopilus junonius]|uniref:chitin deacetylase n=1 Tax=Gymnopilus junonius TaxID=109634 RepID=A0A9P5NWE9_GYMJU|nr:hypothetical protein CPB84DRAFT_1770184 [Gymnopilus junonius]